MSTIQPALRPRSRTPTREIEQANDKRSSDEGRQPELAVAGDSRPVATRPVVLARLPEIAEPPAAKTIAHKLTWVLNFRWQHRLRRLVQMEPNYLAGGVLALVVFLLVMITMRNRDGNTSFSSVAASTVAATPASVQPTTAPAASSTPIENPDVVGSAESQPAKELPQQANSVTPIAGATSETIQSPPAADPLAGVYYPRTSFAPPAGISFEQIAAQSVAAFAEANGSSPADGVRTAMRDRIESGAPQAAPIEPGVARLDGTISRPR